MEAYAIFRLYPETNANFFELRSYSFIFMRL